MNTTPLDLTVQVFNSTGTQEVVGVRTPAMVDARGYPVTEQRLGNVNVNGLITPVGPCPNGRAYAICVLQEPALIAPTTAAPAAPPTTVAPVAPATSVG